MSNVFEKFLSWIKGLFGRKQGIPMESAVQKNPIDEKQISIQLCETANKRVMEKANGARELPCTYVVGISEYDYNYYYAERKNDVELGLVGALEDYAMKTESHLEYPHVKLVIDSSLPSGMVNIEVSFKPIQNGETLVDNIRSGKEKPSSKTPSSVSPMPDVTEEGSTLPFAKGQNTQPAAPARSYVAEVIMNNGRKFAIRGERTTIGIIRPDNANEKPDVAMPYSSALEYCSQLHGEFTKQGEGAWSYRTISENDTLIIRDGDEYVVETVETIQMQSGDRMAFGGRTPIATFVIRETS